MSGVLTYFYLLPLAIVVAILATSAGISGSNFWIPIYLLLLGIDPKTSFWLAPMLFGFGSAVVKNAVQTTINWSIVGQYLKIAVPFAILGSLLVPFAPVYLLLALFGSFVIIYGVFLIFRFGLFYNANGSAIPAREEKIYRIRAAIAGFLKGLIATGTGKIIMPCVLKHCKIQSPAEAVGSTVFIIFVVNLFAAAFRLTPDFISVLSKQKDLIFAIMLWVAPGVIIGGQLGPTVARKLSARGIRCYVEILLVLVGWLIYLRTFSG
jgi:hypothetical protein